MGTSSFKIGAEAVDTTQLAAEIPAQVEHTRKEDVHDHARIARAERANLVQLRSRAVHVSLYRGCGTRRSSRITVRPIRIRVYAATQVEVLSFS